MDNKPRIYSMSFASVYPHYVTKAEGKGRTKRELNKIIYWLTGYDSQTFHKILKTNTDFETFFTNAPKLNPKRQEITGSVCGVKVQDIKESLMREIRYLDKLVDELAKGKEMSVILRD